MNQDWYLLGNRYSDGIILMIYTIYILARSKKQMDHAYLDKGTVRALLPLR